MLLETLQRNKDIKWSEEYIHADGEPAYTHGLVLVRVGEEAVRLTQSQKLSCYRTPGFKSFSLWYGSPISRQIGIRFLSGDCINLEDEDQINYFNEASIGLVTAARQWQTSLGVAKIGEQFLNHLRSTIGENPDPKALKNAGIVKELLAELKNEQLPKDICSLATKLRELGAEEVEEFNGHIVYFPDYLSQLFSSAA